MKLLFRDVKEHTKKRKQAEMNVKLLLLENKRLERVWVGLREACCFLE